MNHQKIYLNEWADSILMSRGGRRMGLPIPDSNPPAHYTPEEVEFSLKIVAYWEGGLEPEDPAAVPVVLEAPAPFDITQGTEDADL